MLLQLLSRRLLLVSGLLHLRGQCARFPFLLRSLLFLRPTVMAPFISDRYTADPFPIPRFYSSPFSAASTTTAFPSSSTSAPRPSFSLFGPSPSSSAAPAEPPLPAASTSPPSLPLPGSSPSNPSNAVSLPGLRWDDTAQTAVGGIGGITASVFGGRVEVWRPAQVGRGERGEGWKACECCSSLSRRGREADEREGATQTSILVGTSGRE